MIHTRALRTPIIKGFCLKNECYIATNSLIVLLQNSYVPVVIEF